MKDYHDSKKALARSQSHWLAIIVSLPIFIAIIIFALPAYSAEKQGIQNAKYDVFAGGIHALEVNLTNDFSQKGRYTVDMQAKTYGLLGKLAPWQGTFVTKGWVLKDRFQPEEHKSTAIWRGEEEVKTYSYGKEGSFKKYRLKDDSNNGSPEKVDKKLTNGTTDILSSTLATMNKVAMSNNCDGTTEVFDGKRRFKLIFKEKRQVTLEKSRWNVYEGPAIECTALVQPIAGKWYEKPRGWASIQEQGRKKGTLPTVWFAKMEEGATAIPVKVRVKTNYGTMFMHLTQYNQE